MSETTTPLTALDRVTEWTRHSDPQARRAELRIEDVLTLIADTHALAATTLRINALADDVAAHVTFESDPADYRSAAGRGSWVDVEDAVRALLTSPASPRTV